MDITHNAYRVCERIKHTLIGNEKYKSLLLWRLKNIDHGGEKGWRGYESQPRSYVAALKIETRWEGINR